MHTQRHTQDQVEPSWDHIVYYHGLLRELPWTTCPLLPPHPLLTPLSYPCGHLYSSTFIYCHPASVMFSSELRSCLASSSVRFPPSLCSVSFLCLSPRPFPLIMTGCVYTRVQLKKKKKRQNYCLALTWTTDRHTKFAIQGFTHSHAQF